MEAHTTTSSSKSETNKMTRSSLYCLSASEVDPGCRERFIDTGYRCENMGIVDCIKTMFVFKCNETFNIWTHLLPFILFAVKFAILFSTELSLSDPFYWPLAANAVGIMGFCITSSCAHTFCALSPHARYVCFYMDYAIINVYSATGWEAYYFYSRPLNSSDFFLADNTKLMALICFKIGVISTFQCCCSRHTKSVLEHLMRVTSFVLPWLCAAFPYIYRLYICQTNTGDCDTTALPMFAYHTVFYVVGAISLASKYPERLFPGRFDYVGHSHQVMHICVAVGAYLQFESVKIEMINKEGRLRDTIINQSYSFYCLHLTLVVFIANFCVAMLFPRVRRILFTDFKIEKKE